jgi:hypothetical protein
MLRKNRQGDAGIRTVRAQVADGAVVLPDVAERCRRASSAVEVNTDFGLVRERYSILDREKKLLCRLAAHEHAR